MKFDRYIIKILHEKVLSGNKKVDLFLYFTDVFLLGELKKLVFSHI